MTDSTETLAVQLARLEERMETRQAEYKTEIGQMQADLASRIDGLATENAKRETRLVVTFAGLLAVAVAFLSLQD